MINTKYRHCNELAELSLTNDSVYEWAEGADKATNIDFFNYLRHIIGEHWPDIITKEELARNTGLAMVRNVIGSRK